MARGGYDGRVNSIAVVTILSAFLASTVEFVEAVTIVLAVGVTRQWRSALIGVGAAVVTLALLIAIFGSALALFVPIGMLRLVVGGFLVIYGLQWLTKAVLRAGGAKAKHDEAAIFAAEVAGLGDEPPVPAEGIDWISFTVAFKGVLLEGLEVAFIVVTFGASANLLGPAVLGAALAGLLVVAVAVVIHRPLERVPENAMKFVVGVMLTGFGTFWSGEGIGIDWPGDDLAILLLLAGYLLVALAGVWAVRSLARRSLSSSLAADAGMPPR
jgi:Ca2+/H+ antiporter, TMEM165/GDT1 family